jgi:hypothetical protein
MKKRSSSGYEVTCPAQPNNEERAMMSNIVGIHSSSPSFANDFRPLIPPGKYKVAFDFFETVYHFGRVPKLILHFHIIDFGEYFETPLARYYTMARIGKPGKGGTFKPVSQTCIFMIEYCRCLSEIRPGSRLDRLPMSEWPKHAYLAEVGSVQSNSHQVALPKQIQYSKIKSLVGVADD